MRKTLLLLSLCLLLAACSSDEPDTPATRRAEGVPSEGRYIVFPLEGGDGLVTAVTAPRAEAHPVGVTYVNVMGMMSMMSSKPFPGLNIEVTHYSDGTTSSEKRMIK